MLKELDLLYGAQRKDIRQPWLALSQGAGFVEGDGFQGAEILKRLPSLDEYAAATCAGDSGFACNFE